MSHHHAQPTRTTQQSDHEVQSKHMQSEQLATAATGAAAPTAPLPSNAGSGEPQHAAEPAIEANAAAASAGSKRKGAGSNLACSEEPSEGSIRPSSSLAAASASSSHLAPVDEPTAQEPTSKRAKPTPPPLHAADILNSPMMRLLGRDSGARQSLMEMLALADFVTAHRVSRLWSAWTAESARVPSVTLTEGSLVGFSRSRWLHRSVRSVEFTTACWTHGMGPRLLSTLSQCIRARDLTLTFPGFVLSPHLSVGFSSVASTLRHLRIKLASSQASILADLFSSVGALQQLRSLVVESIPMGRCFYPSNLGDLSPLSSLPHLERFSAAVQSFPCTPSQLDSLSQCKQLTRLDFSQWLRSSDKPSDSRASEAFATLMRRRKENGAAPFRRLWIGDAPLIRPADWQTLALCTELEEIDARWSCTLTAADWSRLSSFQRLECLSIQCVEWEEQDAALDLCPALSALIHCPRLRRLTVRGEFALGSKEATLLAQLPVLQILCCLSVQIESLAPLSSAPALTELRLVRCFGLDGGPVNIRELIPPMPFLRQLTIEDQFWISRDQAARCAVALLQRLPRLTRDQLRDNFLPAAE